MTCTSTSTYLGELRTKSTHVQSNSIIYTDAPTDNNGKGALFSPTDLTATSLANCMLTVMGIAASKEEIAYSEVRAYVKKIMISAPRRISEIHILIEINHNWSEEEKRHMQTVATNCPVAKSLHPSIKQVVKFNYTV